jgi:hypothetical protein
MRVSILAITLLLPLFACEQPPIYKAEKVDVPVAIPCQASIPAKPKWPTMMIKPDADILTQTRAALAELELRKGYEGELLAELKGCIAK